MPAGRDGAQLGAGGDAAATDRRPRLPAPDYEEQEHPAITLLYSSPHQYLANEYHNHHRISANSCAVLAWHIAA